MIEEWKDIKGYEGYYQVSSCGRVRSLERKIVDNKCVRIFKGTIIKQWILKGKRTNYLCVSLSKNGFVKKYEVHRLVGEAFLPNTLNKPQINHKDCNGLNNNVSNLEWVTNSENAKYAYDSRSNIKNQRLITYNNETHNISDWARKIGINPDTMWARINSGWPIEKAMETPLRSRKRQEK